MRRMLPYQAQLILLALLSAFLLVLPALFNGFPLLFTDSASYLSSGHSGEVPVDRPIMYGLFTRHVSFSFSTWLIIITQSVLLILLFPAFMRQLTGNRDATRQGLLVLVVIAATTCLSLFSSMIMADVFTGMVIMGVIILLFGDEQRKWERILVWVLLVFGTTTHLSHFGLLLAMLVVGTVFHIALFRRHPFPVSRYFGAWSALAASMLLLATVNWFHDGGFRLSRTRYTVLTATLIEKGLVQEYLSSDECSDTSAMYIDRHRLPAHGWEFLWNEDSPLYDDCPEMSRWVDCWTAREDEFRELTSNILNEPGYMRAFVGRGMAAGLKQAVTIAHGPLVRIDTGSVVFPVMDKHYPADSVAYSRSRQYTCDLTFAPRNTVQLLVVLLSLAIVLFTLIRSKSLPRWYYGTVVLTFTGYLANAMIIGLLSGVDGRYQARIAWLPVLVAILGIFTMYHKSGNDPAPE